MKRYESEQRAIFRVTNNDLVCKDCKYCYDDSIRYGNTSVCGIYNAKPNKVLLGGKCTEFTKKD